MLTLVRYHLVVSFLYRLLNTVPKTTLHTGRPVTGALAAFTLFREILEKKTGNQQSKQAKNELNELIFIETRISNMPL